MFCTFETRGKLRTAAEEHNLAANYCAEDAMSAEFICLFVTSKFSGFDLINRLEHESGEEKADEYALLKCKKVPLPDGNKEAQWYNFADVYGFRPPVNALLYLSPWEFVAHWTIVPLLPPWDDKYNYTRWKPPFTIFTEKRKEKN